MSNISDKITQQHLQKILLEIQKKDNELTQFKTMEVVEEIKQQLITILNQP